MAIHSRRDFIGRAAATAAVIIGCRRGAWAAVPQPAAGEVLDAGPLSDYPDDDVYDKYRQDGALLIRRDKQIWALSSICTHKGCKVRVADDLSLFCKCHGSTFDRNGHVTKGPAKRDLPRLPVRLNDDRHVLVDLNLDLS